MGVNGAYPVLYLSVPYWVVYAISYSNQSLFSIACIVTISYQDRWQLQALRRR